MVARPEPPEWDDDEDGRSFGDRLSEWQDWHLLTPAAYWAAYWAGSEDAAAVDRTWLCEVEDDRRAGPRPFLGGASLWRHLHQAHPNRLAHLWGRLRHGYGWEDAWSLDAHLARIMARCGREYIARGCHTTYTRPGFRLWVEGMEHVAAGCSCPRAVAACNALPDIFRQLWL